MKDSAKWFTCECTGEAIRVEKIEDEDLPDEYWFALYRLGAWNPSLMWRIKAAWRVLVKGEVHEDQVSFSEDTARELRDYLNDIL